MISTKDLSGLPNAERLKKFCKGLAALDIIMVEELHPPLYLQPCMAKRQGGILCHRW